MDTSPTPDKDRSADPTPEQAPAAADPRAAATPSAEETAPPVPLTPIGWLTQNGIYIVVLVVAVGYFYSRGGLEAIFNALLTVLGLSFVVFIHELGHFLVAKWCDVHVLTFSIGFGPALPGCSFKRGETTYKIAVLPLGGYVRMVGEGTEADEDEDYPRSYKNKSVGQRMMIISAGVIMNVLLGAVLLIFVYRTHGMRRAPAVVARVDDGSPAWVAGVRTGWTISRIGDKNNPTFDDLQRKVKLSGAGSHIPFEFKEVGTSRTVSLNLEPSRDENNSWPVIGVSPPDRLQLLTELFKRAYRRPVQGQSSAAAARELDLKPGEVILATTDPLAPAQLKPLAHNANAGTWDYVELAQRLRRRSGQPFKIQTTLGERELPPDGFQFNDVIVGTTQPNQPGSYNPYLIEPLPLDPRATEPGWCDPFVYRQRLVQLAGKPMVIQVRRGGQEGAVANLFVPPSYHLVLPGVRMKMGEVGAVRENSPATRAGVIPRQGEDQRGDVVISVTLTTEKGEPLLTVGEEDLDPIRLPDQLTRAAMQHPHVKKRAQLTVLRRNKEEKTPSRHTLQLDWDDSWTYDNEVPLSPAAPQAIPQLGLAYWVTSLVDHIEPNWKPTITLEQASACIPLGAPPTLGTQLLALQRLSDLTEPQLQEGDVITQVNFKLEERKGAWGEENWEESWGKASKLEAQRGSEKKNDTWAHVAAAMQRTSFHEIQLQVRRGGNEETVTMALVEDPTWPRAQPGVQLMMDTYLQRADNLGAAMRLGLNETVGFIQDMYLGLLRMVTLRISAKTVGGPISILSQTYDLAGADYYSLIAFLGVISLNLAVVNFLPIPLLDGGHMVFLLYEKIRGKPAPEQVQAAAAYLGLAFLLLLMVCVFVIDIRRLTGGL